MKHILLPLAAALLLGTAPAAFAAPCSESIKQAQAALDSYLDALAAAGPSAPESTDALLNHEPSPSSIARAEAALGDGDEPEIAQEALDRARAAEMNGNAAACEVQVARARVAIGVK